MIGPNSLDQLIREAVGSSPGERVERYRDRLAALGDVVVSPLLTLERRQPAMGLFVTTVLEAAARMGAAQARTGLDVLASKAKDLVTRTAAREARSRTDNRRVSHADLTQAILTRTGNRRVSQIDVTQPIVTTGNRSRSPEEIIQLINSARERRGEPVLDAAEAQQVLGNLERRAAGPDHYRNVCWKCSAAVDAATNEPCLFCRWLVCWCGGCRAPNFVDRRTGKSGHCRQEVWLAVRELQDADEVIDFDYRDAPILTAGPPALDEKAMRALLARRGVRSVFHWTPLRNLGSVLERGLLSREGLARRRIPIVPHGYGSIEKEEALRDHVCVSLEPKPWMMHQWSETPIVLEIDPASLLAEGTLFVPGNSASRVFEAKDLLTMSGLSSIERLFRTGSVTPQAEAWIRPAVPRIAIRGIHVPDASVAQFVQARGFPPHLPHQPLVSVTPEFFTIEALGSHA